MQKRLENWNRIEQPTAGGTRQFWRLRTISVHKPHGLGEIFSITFCTLNIHWRVCSTKKNVSCDRNRVETELHDKTNYYFKNCSYFSVIVGGPAYGGIHEPFSRAFGRVHSPAAGRRVHGLLLVVTDRNNSGWQRNRYRTVIHDQEKKTTEKCLLSVPRLCTY